MARDVGADLRYFSPRTPRDFAAGGYSGLIELVMAGEPGAAGPDGRVQNLVAEGAELHAATITDARTAEGGLGTWSLDEHGFAFVPAPEAVDFRDRHAVQELYEPRVCEAVKRQTGASRVLFMSHAFRSNGAFAQFAHTDYGPDFEPLLRRMLVGRYGVSEADAASCGMVAAGLWTPVGHPAFLDPLALLDASSVDIERDVVRFIDVRSDLGFGGGNRPEAERVPAATQDAPALAPLWHPSHRWVFCSDMTPSESVLFKQFDFRRGAKAAAAFHHSFTDPRHAHSGLPKRKSVECRLLLLFDEDGSDGKARL